MSAPRPWLINNGSSSSNNNEVIPLNNNTIQNNENSGLNSFNNSNLFSNFSRFSPGYNGTYLPYSLFNSGYGLNSSPLGFLEKLNQYLFSLCDISNMLQMNAQNLFGFFDLLKKIICESNKYFHETLLKCLKSFFVKLFNIFLQCIDYIKKYQSKNVLKDEELRHQIKVLSVLKFISFSLLLVFILRFIIGIIN